MKNKNTDKISVRIKISTILKIAFLKFDRSNTSEDKDKNLYHRNLSIKYF